MISLSLIFVKVNKINNINLFITGIQNRNCKKDYEILNSISNPSPRLYMHLIFRLPIFLYKHKSMFKILHVALWLLTWYSVNIFYFNEIWSFYSTKLLSRASFLRQVDATVHNLDWPSTTWIDRLHLGPTVYIRDQLSTYEGPWPVATGTDHLHMKVRDRLYTKVRDRLHTKVVTGYK